MPLKCGTNFISAKTHVVWWLDQWNAIVLVYSTWLLRIYFLLELSSPIYPWNSGFLIPHEELRRFFMTCKFHEVHLVILHRSKTNSPSSVRVNTSRKLSHCESNIPQDCDQDLTYPESNEPLWVFLVVKNDKLTKGRTSYATRPECVIFEFEHN